MNPEKKSIYQIVWIKWNVPEIDNDWTIKNVSYDEQEDLEYKDEEGPHMMLPFPFPHPAPVKIATEKDFNFWMGHTNFPISQPILELITLCPGVESADILTQYRFRIGIGMLFKSNEVMSGLTQAAIGYLQNNATEIQSNLY